MATPSSCTVLIITKEPIQRQQITATRIIKIIFTMKMLVKMFTKNSLETPYNTMVLNYRIGFCIIYIEQTRLTILRCLNLKSTFNAFQFVDLSSGINIIVIIIIIIIVIVYTSL